jgi:predicted RNase H-like HicB family nuclease
MKPAELLLRCYAEKKDGQWQAFCLDLCLAAQGDSFQEVKRKLGDMIAEYVGDALGGRDKDFAAELLMRRAPFKYWLKFYYFLTLSKVGALHDGVRRMFCQALPLEPTKLKHAA